MILPLTDNRKEMESRARKIILEAANKLVNAVPPEDLKDQLIQALGFRIAVLESKISDAK